MTTKVNSRLTNLRRELSQRQLDAILISQPENRHYLSGFTGSAGHLLITGNEAVLATDFRYTEQATAQAPEYRIFQLNGNLPAWLPELIATLDNGKLGFETGYLTFSQHQQLSDTLKEARSGISLVPVNGLVESMRATKEPEEVELISRAAEIADTAFEATIDRIQTGMTEKQVAWELEKSMRVLGSQPIPFEVIVASGPNAALPHAKPTEREIKPGETIVIDMGASVGGYCSDLSRTICLGTSDDTFKQVYKTVLKAQLAAIAGTREGMSGREADALARTVIEKAGYGKAFGHSLGHGVGLAAHEEPHLSQNSPAILKASMVFSIEPGIYLSGWGGVRIEDLVVMDDGKPRLLSKARKMDSGGLILT